MSTPRDESPRPRRPRQERVLAYVQVLEHERRVRVEVAVPQASWAIDGLVAIGAAPSDGWGPLREHVSDRLVVVEHFSRPPRLLAFVRARTKLALIADRWHHRRPAERTGARVPLLLVLSEGRPRTALAQLPQLVACGPSASWRGQRSTLGDVLVVDLTRLPDAPGNSVLRLFPVPRSARAARQRIAALLADEAVLSSTRERIQEAIMRGDIPGTDPEKRSIMDTLRDTLREQLAHEAELKGNREGKREATLALVRELLGEDAACELETLEDCDQLHARALELLRPVNRR